MGIGILPGRIRGWVGIKTSLHAEHRAGEQSFKNGRIEHNRHVQKRHKLQFFLAAAERSLSGRSDMLGKT